MLEASMRPLPAPEETPAFTLNRLCGSGLQAIVSGAQVIKMGDADAVVAPAFDGEVGILPRHAPFMTLLGAGRLVIRQGGTSRTVTVRGGFLQVVGDAVRVVAEHAEEARNVA